MKPECCVSGGHIERSVGANNKVVYDWSESLKRIVYPSIRGMTCFLIFRNFIKQNSYLTYWAEPKILFIIKDENLLEIWLQVSCIIFSYTFQLLFLAMQGKILSVTTRWMRLLFVRCQDLRLGLHHPIDCEDVVHVCVKLDSISYPNISCHFVHR